MTKVTKITRPLLATMFLGFVTHCTDDQFAALANLNLIAMGVIDGDGNLKPDYEQSAWWNVTTDGELESRASEYVAQMQVILDKMKDASIPK